MKFLVKDDEKTRDHKDIVSILYWALLRQKKEEERKAAAAGAENEGAIQAGRMLCALTWYISLQSLLYAEKASQRIGKVSVRQSKKQ